MRYIAMNNFQVAADQAEAFEERWRRRQSYLQGAPGFESFQLLRGENHNGTIHYV
jgi:heme-degrading monooxygenase HmoA